MRSANRLLWTWAIVSGLLFGAQDLVIGWLTELQQLEADLTAGEQLKTATARFATVLTEVRDWAAASGVRPALPPPSDKLATPEQLRRQISSLRQFLEDYERTRAGSGFHLGRVEVRVVGRAPGGLSAESVDPSQSLTGGGRSLVEALTALPGVNAQRVGSRNESGVFLRGFDRRQVPLYVDGIPVYQPYDGTADLERFWTAAVAEVEVSKSFTSASYGPNTLGGAINLVTREPDARLRLDLWNGFSSGRGRDASVHAGTLGRRYWFQGGLDYSARDWLPLPSQSGASNRRANSDRSELGGQLQAAWLGRGKSRYSFRYSGHSAEKGHPPYAGLDPAVAVRYWRWPQWDKRDIYLLAAKDLGSRGLVRARLYADSTSTYLRSFDDASYSTQLKRSSFNSPTRDGITGAVLDWENHADRTHRLKFSGHWREELHREGNLGEPQRHFRDSVFTAGVEDRLNLGPRWQALAGFSLAHLRVRRADDFRQGALVPFPTNTLLAVSPQAALLFQAGRAGTFYWTAGRRTRLPTMKERYSYRMGQALPNPDLKPERARQFEAGYRRSASSWFWVEAAGFLYRVHDSAQRYYLQPNLYQVRNWGRAEYLGAEFSSRFQLRSQLWARLNYTYLNRRGRSEPAPLLVEVPRHIGLFSASWTPPGRLALYAESRYEAARLAQNDAGRVLRLGSFVVLNVSVTCRLARGLELQAGASNLLDRAYYLADGYPEEGRNVFTKLRYRF
ncbi:MAG: TonB-dependent receptor [Bryobacteraceae bacterium]|nr:TonB-dependent receptor [Bryobacteraceae bacterium]